MSGTEIVERRSLDTLYKELSRVLREAITNPEKIARRKEFVVSIVDMFKNEIDRLLSYAYSSIQSHRLRADLLANVVDPLAEKLAQFKRAVLNDNLADIRVVANELIVLIDKVLTKIRIFGVIGAEIAPAIGIGDLYSKPPELEDDDFRLLMVIITEFGGKAPQLYLFRRMVVGGGMDVHRFIRALTRLITLGYAERYYSPAEDDYVVVVSHEALERIRRLRT